MNYYNLFYILTLGIVKDIQLIMNDKYIIGKDNTKVIVYKIIFVIFNNLNY